MKIETSSICDIGLKRKRNQDSILVYRDDPHQFALFIVADGMGGYADGERASSAIVNGIQEWLAQAPAPDHETDISTLLQTIRDQMVRINDFILAEWNQQQICGSTCVLLATLRNYYGFFAVGDSRIYQSRGLRCGPITKDDVWENQPHIRSRYSEKELQSHPNYGKLAHAMGSDPTLAYSMQAGGLQSGDVFALCSDGIYKMCSSRFLAWKLRTCRRKNLDLVRDEIMQEVRRNGAKDNASLILVRCSDF